MQYIMDAIQPVKDWLEFLNIVALTVYMIFIGYKTITRKANKHEKYLILSKRVVRDAEGIREYIVSENDIIKDLTDEVGILKSRINIIEKQNQLLSNIPAKDIFRFIIWLIGVQILITLHLKKNPFKKPKNY